jgi:Ca2+:H+ antiporter
VSDRFRNDTLSMAVRKKQLSRARYIPIGTQLRTIFFSNYLSMMLAPCIPAGFVVYYVRSNPITAFCINFAAIAPSAAVLSVATNELKIRSGEKLSALLNHTLG